MTRLEPNLLLALSTGFALVLLVMTASFYSPSVPLLRNALLAVICAGGFVLLNPVLQRMMRLPERPPMINRDAAHTGVWSALFPLAAILAAAIPMIWPGRDYGLLVIIGAVWFGVTAESAIKARAQAG
ncbi:MAG: hypothetical protein ACXW3O_06950 [Brevundimonas sp.]